MKKTPKSNRPHRSSRMKKNLSTNRKTTTFHLESLEPRQMLSGISFATVDLNGDTVETDYFHVTLSDESGGQVGSPQYVTMNVVSSTGKVIDPSQIQIEGATPLQTTTDEESKVTSILYQMGFGTDYSVTVSGLAEGESLKVLFTLPGDKDSNGISTEEYYGAYGEVLKGNGINAQFVKMYKNRYGVDLTENHMNTLWDLNGDGRFSTEEFELLFSSTSTIDLQQTITTNPDILNLLVNGEELRENGVVSGNKLTLSGKLSEMDTDKHILAMVTWLQGDQVVGYHTTYNLTTGKVAGLNPDIEGYKVDEEGNFTWFLSPAVLGDKDGVFPDGKVTLTLYGGKCDTQYKDGNTWDFWIDTVAPSIMSEGIHAINGQNNRGNFDGVSEFYGRYDEDGNLNFELSFRTNLDSEAFWEAISDDRDGIYIDIERSIRTGSNDGKDILEDRTTILKNYRLTKENLLAISGTVYILSLSLSKNDIEWVDSTLYYLEFTPHDLAGNKGQIGDSYLRIYLTTPSAAPIETNYNITDTRDGVDCYTDGSTFREEAANVKIEFEDKRQGLIYYSIDDGAWNSTWGQSVTLGLSDWNADHTLRYYLVDGAGNAIGSEEYPFSWRCVINTPPMLTGAGKNLHESTLVQRDGAADVTVALEEMFDDKGDLTYGVVSHNERIVVNNDNGVLTFTFAQLEEGEIAYNGSVSVTARDQYNETCILTFTVEYTIDNEAPQADDIQIVDGDGKRLDSDWNETDYDIVIPLSGIASTEFKLIGKIQDISEIKQFTLDVVYSDTSKNHSLTVKDPSKDCSSDDGKILFTAADKFFSISVDEPSFTLYVYGTDEYGNTTNLDNAQKITVFGDSVAPTAEIGEITVNEKTALDGTFYINKQQPSVTVDVEEAENSSDTCWVQLWNQENLLGSGRVVNGTVTIEVADSLLDGNYTFRAQIVDGVGNKGAFQELSVTIDTVVPTIAWNQEDFTLDQPGTEREYYTNTEQTVHLSVTDTNATGGVWSITRNEESVDYSENGVSLVSGANAFTATFTDAAGNVSEPLLFTILANDIPTPTKEKQGDSIQDNSEAASYSREYLLDDWFANTIGILTYSVSGGEEGISTTLNGNRLTVDFSAWQGNTNRYGDYTFTVVATDSYGERGEATLTITYTNDNLPPQLTNVLVNGKEATNWNGNLIWVPEKTTVPISATVSEPSGVEELYLAILYNDKVVEGWERVNLMEFSGENLTYDNSTRALAIEDLTTLLGKSALDGKYTLVLYGSDTLGNTSVEKGEAEEVTYSATASRVDIIVDGVSPNVTLRFNTPPQVTNSSNPDLTLALTFQSDYNEPHGIQLQIWATKDNESVLYAQDFYSGSGPSGETITYKLSGEALNDGTWAFTAQAIDVVGNTTTTSNATNVRIDTVPPPAAELRDSIDETYNGDLYTEKEIVYFTCSEEDTTITVNNGNYSEDGFKLLYGENTLIVVTTDVAGNKTEKEFVIHYNTPPTRTEAVLDPQIAEFENGTVTLRIPEASIQALFTQNDSATDTLEYGLLSDDGGSFTAGDFQNGVYIFTGENVSEAATQLATVHVQVRDKYGKMADDYSFFAYKENLAPGWDSSATLVNGSLQVTLPQKYEDISYTFDVPVKDAETALESLIFPSGEQACNEGSYSFAYVDGKWTCTFIPHDTFTSGTVTLSFPLTDVGYGPTSAQTTNMSIQLEISAVNRAPTRTDAVIPTVAAKVGESVTINLSQYASYFVDPDGDSLTISLVEGGNATLQLTEQAGMYTFTPTTYGAYTFSIAASDGELSSESVTVTIVVAGALEIQDASLDATSESRISANTPTVVNFILAESLKVTSPVTLGNSSVLKAETFLKAGTNLGGNSYERVIPEDLLEYDLSIRSFVLSADYSLTSDLVVSSTIVLAADSVVAPNSLLQTGTQFTEVTDLKVVSVAPIQAIYNAYRTSGTLLESRYSLESLGLPSGSSVSSVSATPLDENSCFASFTLSEDGQLVVQYKPYQTTQDRSPVEILLISNDGVEIPMTISIEYEKPFRFETRLVASATDTTDSTDTRSQKSKEPTDSVSSIVPGQTYFLEVWGVCDIPIYQEAFLSNYQNPAVILTTSMTIPKAVADQIEISSENTAISKYEEQEDDSYLLTCGNLSVDANGLLIALGSSTFCGYDGYYERLGLYTITTKEGIQEFSIATNLTGGECSLSFQFAGETEPFVAGSASHSQKFLVNDVHVGVASPLRGTESARETVVEGSGIYLSLVKDKTDGEQTQTLRESEAYLTEWDSSWVELWVNTQEKGIDLKKVQVDLSYDATLFTASSLEYGSAVEGLEVLWEDGKIIGIGGDLSNAVTNEDGFVLLARVSLEPTAGKGVSADNVGAVKAGLVLENIALHKSNGEQIDANNQVYVNTNIFPVVYDSNDDGRIDIDDLITFSRLFGTSSADSTDPLVWGLDFDKSGQIDIDDLIAFSKNFGLTRVDAAEILYPERFMEQWIGSMKIGTGDANVGKMLETAIRQWEEKLNEALSIDVQIIVKDLDDSEKILGQTVLVGLDENGAPGTAVVYLDDDALGQGWFVSEDGLIPSEQYDLYTVLLHELGHALGFNASYTGYTDTIDSPISYTDDAGEKHYLRPDGHVEDDSDDLMYYEINPGERKEISALDAEIVRKAREAGGMLEDSIAYAIQGTVSPEVSSSALSEVVVSTIMEESQWNAMLVSAATKEVRKVEQVTDKAWEAMDSELLTTDNTQRASSMLDEWDWQEEEDSLESLLDEMVVEPLNVKLEK